MMTTTSKRQVSSGTTTIISARRKSTLACSWFLGCTTAWAGLDRTCSTPLRQLVKWVEQGVAPETIIATKFVNDTPPAVQMTRPLCVFPKVAKYKGSGSTNVADNFTCVTDEPDFNQTPGTQIRSVTRYNRSQ